MNTPTVIIRTNGSLESLYTGIREMLNEKYHAPGNCFPSATISATEQTEINTLAAYAANIATSAGLPPGVRHIERWLT